MKWILGVLFVVLLFVVGCSQGESIDLTPDVDLGGETAEVEEESESSEKSMEDEVEEVEEPEPAEEVAAEPVETTPAKQMDNAVVELLKLAESDVKSMSYVHYGPPDQQEGYVHYIKGNKVKIVKSTQSKYDAKVFYDTVYLDLISKTAQAYCESPDCDPMGERGTVSFDEEYKKMPLDWLDEIEYAEIIGDETIDNSLAIKLSFESIDGSSGTIWINEFRGVPVKVTVGDEKYEYSGLSTNALNDGDVTP